MSRAMWAIVVGAAVWFLMTGGAAGGGGGSVSAPTACDPNSSRLARALCESWRSVKEDEAAGRGR